MLGGVLDVAGLLGAGDDRELPPVTEDGGGGADPTVGELGVCGGVDVDVPVEDLGRVAPVPVAVGEVAAAARERVRRVAQDQVDGLVDRVQKLDGVLHAHLDARELSARVEQDEA